ncbi:MAG: acetyl-CoA hydrolase/transferase C-terminal domain-containing protein [Porphyromonas sp.]|nr:acetyl-CoA hydrolase/transferase C-terminal domain-containing protein [Porphyromonas sp.]
MSAKPTLMTLERAVSHIKNGEKVVLGHAAVTPHIVLEEIFRQRERFSPLHLFHLIYMDEPLHLAPEMAQHFRVHTPFVSGAPMREAVWEGRAEYIPAHFSRVPRFFSKGGYFEPDWTILQVTPPDNKGRYNCSLSCDFTLPAARASKHVLAVINDQLPYIHGDNYLTADQIDIVVEHSAPPYEAQERAPSPVEQQIALNCANLIPDGATLQIGIGAIPDALLHHLKDRKDLGIHTELLTPGVAELFASGAITNRKKGFHNGVMVGSFAVGNRELYEWLDHNPIYEQYPVEHINAPFNISRNYRMTSVNSCTEVSLAGEVCSERVHGAIYSGTGGQFDYVRGVQYSEGGMSILAFPSTAGGGKYSRITPTLSPGNVVTTHRNDVDYLVTEYGVAHLMDRNEQQRAEALIEIAHPKFREELRASLK